MSMRVEMLAAALYAANVVAWMVALVPVVSA